MTKDTNQQNGARVYARPSAASLWRLPQPIGPRTVVRWLLVLAAIALVGWIISRAGSSATPFVVGLALAYLLLPLVRRLDRFMPRWASILVVYVLGIGAIALAINYIVPPVANQIGQFIANVPEYIRSAEEEFNKQIPQLRQRLSPEIEAQVNQQIETVQQTIRNNATTYAQNIGTFLFSSVVTLFQTIAFIIGFLVIPFFLFYVLVDADAAPNAIDRVLHPRIRSDFWNIWGIVDGVVGRYIRGQLLLGLVIGGATFLGLTALRLLNIDIPYVVLLSIVAGFGELIPVVGPIISAIPAILVAIGQGPDAVLAVIAVFVIIQQLENQVLVPRIVGNTLRLHPALLMALLVVAAAVGGLGLVIVSAPLAAMGRDVFVYMHRRLREPPWSPERAIAGLAVDEGEVTPRREPARTTDVSGNPTKRAAG
jgi:predicted PurR-regulated permease PerM